MRPHQVRVRPVRSSKPKRRRHEAALVGRPHDACNACASLGDVRTHKARTPPPALPGVQRRCRRAAQKSQRRMVHDGIGFGQQFLCSPVSFYQPRRLFNSTPLAQKTNEGHVTSNTYHAHQLAPVVIALSYQSSAQLVGLAAPVPHGLTLKTALESFGNACPAQLPERGMIFVFNGELAITGRSPATIRYCVIANLYHEHQ